ncbi:hypothetical protein Dimus_029038 [Dionaea muscipula]
MDVELVKCECCGLKEECTGEYINGVKERFSGKWLCGLCSEAVRDEVNRSSGGGGGGGEGGGTAKKQYRDVVEEAVKAHVSFCRKYKSNPAFRVADGMRQMLRRRSSGKLCPSSSSSSSSSKKYARSLFSSQAGGESSFSI